MQEKEKGMTKATPRHAQAWTACDIWVLERTQATNSWGKGREVGWWKISGGSRRYALLSVWVFSANEDTELAGGGRVGSSSRKVGS